MLQSVAAIGGGAFILASLVVGLRLLLLSLRTRELPEFALGFGLFTMGGLGYPLTVVAVQGFGLSQDARVALFAADMGLTAVGITMLAVFTRRVFRPTEAWALVAVWIIGAAQGAIVVWQALSPGIWRYVTAREGAWNADAVVVIGTLAWAGLESLAYWAKLRRRQRLGLVDPLLAQRFAFWGSSILTAAGISLIGHVLEHFGVSMAGSAAGALVIGPLGLVMSATVWMAFFPPAAYARWLLARTPQHG